MISGIFHQGSGLGNQLHRYVATRICAEENGFAWGMLAPELFKGASFMQLDTGHPAGEWYVVDGGRVVPMVEPKHFFMEKKVVEDGVDIRGYDPEFNFIEDNTMLDGEFQDSRYFEDHLPKLRQWLAVEPLEMPDNLCIIGFRGGEFKGFPDLFLTYEYWNRAIDVMRQANPNMRFKVVTDDVVAARKFFPFEISHEISNDWRSVRYAKYLILSNSSFYILPTLLNENVKLVVAPRYWARRNTKKWAMPANYYKDWLYV